MFRRQSGYAGGAPFCFQALARLPFCRKFAPRLLALYQLLPPSSARPTALPSGRISCLLAVPPIMGSDDEQALLGDLAPGPDEGRLSSHVGER
eukprot:14861510-Heterocapsa_arctica.AAC.1